MGMTNSDRPVYVGAHTTEKVKAKLRAEVTRRRESGDKDASVSKLVHEALERQQFEAA